MANKPMQDKNTVQKDRHGDPSLSPLTKEHLWTKNFVCIWIINLMLIGWSFMLQATFPFYLIDLGANEMIVGATAAAASIASIIMRPFSGWILDNISRKFLLFAALIIFIACLALMTLVPILGFVIAFRVITGFTNSAASTASSTNAVDAIPPARFGEGLSHIGLGNTLGSALGPSIGLTIMVAFGFPPLFITGIAMLFLAAVTARVFTFRGIDKTKRKKFILSNLFSAQALPASTVQLLASVPFGGLSIFIALYGEIYGVGNGAIFFVLLAAGSGISRLISGRLIDKYGERPMVIFGNACYIIALITLMMLGSEAAYYISGAVYGFGIGMLNPSMKTMALRTVPPEKRGAGTSTFQILQDISMGLGGLLAGALVTALGYRQMFGVLIIFVIISYFAYFLWAAKTPSAFRADT